MYFDPYNPFVLVPYHHGLDLGMWRRMIALAGWPGAACLSLGAAWPSLVAARAWVGIDQCTQDQRPQGCGALALHGERAGITSSGGEASMGGVRRRGRWIGGVGRRRHERMKEKETLEEDESVCRL